MTSIFISYRRAGSRAYTGRIYDRPVHAFGAHHVFKDVEDIPPRWDDIPYSVERCRSCPLSGTGWQYEL